MEINCYNVAGDKMRIAILTVTDTGFKLAEKISARTGGDIFGKGKNFDSLKNFVAEIFTKFDALIFICATGIAVRVIAPHIVSKLQDPAVIVIDERGQNVISLLSGHVGGANELTLKIAAALNANPVITTATDVENKFAVDSFAAKLGLRPEPKDAIKIINSAILHNEEIYLTAGNTTLNTEKISFAVNQACKMINQPLERIKLLASVDIKSDEIGLLEFAKNLGAEIKFFSTGELAKKIAEYKLSESKFVKDTIGVGNICEAAALCCVENAKFALPKKIFDGVTVCLIWEK